MKETELPVVMKLQTLVTALCQYPPGQNEGNRTTCSNEATNLGYSTMSVPTRSEQKETELPVVMKLQTLVIALCQYPPGQNRRKQDYL